MFKISYREKERMTHSSTAKSLGLQIVSKVSADNVLIISPHPDDDVFGCGGLINKLAKSGAKIKSLYIFDGAKGNKSGRIDYDLVREREIEVFEATKIVGISEVNFERLRDESSRSSKVWERILVELNDRKWDLVLVPSHLDWHRDHLVVNQAFKKAYAKVHKNRPKVWFYNVWGVCPPNLLVPIESEIARKKAATKCYKSQLKVKPYDEAMLAMNEYLGKVFAIEGGAEAYSSF